MDDPGALLDVDEARLDHEERRLLGDQVLVERLVGLADQVLGGELLQHLVLALEDVEAGLGEDDVDRRLALRRAGAAGADLDVLDVGPHRQGDVAGQRPRGRGPGQEVGAGLVRELEEHVDAGVLDVVLVPLRELVGAERGHAPRAVGDDLEPLVEQLLLPHVLEQRPHRLHVGRLVGDVGVVEVEPEADAVGELDPLADVPVAGLLALLVELVDAVGLDVLLGLEAQLLLDLHLDRQPVGVPAALADHPVAAHRLVAREEVLEGARQHVVQPGEAVGGRGAFVENPVVGLRALVNRALKDVLLLPEGAHPPLQLGEADLAVDGLEHG